MEAPPVRRTDVHGMVAFPFDEETYPSAGFEVEVTIDGTVRRVRVERAAATLGPPSGSPDAD